MEQRGRTEEQFQHWVDQEETVRVLLLLCSDTTVVPLGASEEAV